METHPEASAGAPGVPGLAVLDALEAPLAVVQRDGRIVLVNRAWRAYAEANGGDPRTTDVGANYFRACDTRHARDAAYAERALQGFQAVLSGAQDTFELEYPCHTMRSLHWHVVRATRLRMNDVPYLVVEHHDVTERRLAFDRASLRARELEDSMRSLRLLNHRLHGLAYQADHELRAPLRALEEAAAALQAEPPGDSEDWAERARQVHAEASRLRDRLEGMLHLARQTDVEPAPVPVDISAYAREALVELRRRSPYRLAEVDIEDGLRAQGEPALVRALVRSLVEHAWSATRGREPALVEVRGRPGQPAVFEVADNGEALEARQLDRVLEPSAGPPPAEALEEPRLATAARMVRLHGGRIWAEPRPRGGAVMAFTLERGAAGV